MNLYEKRTGTFRPALDIAVRAFWWRIRLIFRSELAGKFIPTSWSPEETLGTRLGLSLIPDEATPASITRPWCYILYCIPILKRGISDLVVWLYNVARLMWTLLWPPSTSVFPAFSNYTRDFEWVSWPSNFTAIRPIFKCFGWTPAFTEKSWLKSSKVELASLM